MMFLNPDICHSYGLAGEEIILITLQYCIFSVASDASNVLWGTLFEILNTEHRIPCRATFWQGFQPANFLLEDFMHYIVGPFITNLLISEDQGVVNAQADIIHQKAPSMGKLSSSLARKLMILL
jgi:hypothetical protein